MKKFDVEISLEAVREAKAEWAKGVTKFNSDVTFVMARLLREAARNYMSAEEVSKASGFTVKRVRQMMRDIGLNPRDGKTLLSKKAATALAENAALMGIEPHEVDLMSPLAYLPMGEKMKRELQDRSVSQVHEVSGNQEPLAKGLWCAECEFFEPFETLDTANGPWTPCEGCGCPLASHQSAAVVADEL